MRWAFHSAEISVNISATTPFGDQSCRSRGPPLHPCSCAPHRTLADNVVQLHLSLCSHKHCSHICRPPLAGIRCGPACSSLLSVRRMPKNRLAQIMAFSLNFTRQSQKVVCANFRSNCTSPSSSVLWPLLRMRGRGSQGAESRPKARNPMPCA